MSDTAEIVVLLRRILNILSINYPTDAPQTDANITRKHTPFSFEGTLFAWPANPVTELLVRSDPVQGLGSAGRTGYISNTGANSLEYRIYDGSAWSEWMTVLAFNIETFDRADDIWFDKVQLRSRVGTTCICRFTR